MADKPTAGGTQSTGAAQGRFTVSIPAELAAAIDKLIENTAETLRQATGVAVELSRPQMVESLIKSALRAQDAAKAGE